MKQSDVEGADNNVVQDNVQKESHIFLQIQYLDGQRDIKNMFLLA